MAKERNRLWFMEIAALMITAWMATAAWAPDVSGYGTYFDDSCLDCHDTGGDVPYDSRTCAGCHAHGVHPDSGKDTLNISATPDSSTYSPGDTIVVSVTGGYRAGWVRVQMWDLNCSTDGTCTQANVLAQESLYTSGSEVDFPGPVLLSATAPSAPGNYTWYAGWYGNAYDKNGALFGTLWLPDISNSGHGNELVAFSFTVTAVTGVCGDGTVDAGEACDEGAANGTTTSCCGADCTYTPASAPCDDGQYCNGSDTCDGAGACQPGTLVDCDDGVGCTDDSCDEGSNSCVNIQNDANCGDDGQFCNGAEFCDPVSDCSSAGDPCGTGETCNEENDTCVAPPAVIDLDIARFWVTTSIRLAKVKPIDIKLVVKNNGTVNSATRPATVTGVQNGVEIFAETRQVSDEVGNGRSTYLFGPYTPTATGEILWSATISDDDPDDDTAAAVTTVK